MDTIRKFTWPVSFQGRLSSIQYMPKKPHKWGMKAWVLADLSNGYVWKWELYTGKHEIGWCRAISSSGDVIVKTTTIVTISTAHQYCLKS